MEWTGQQQVWFLLQSIGVGALQGLLLDVATGFVPVTRRKHWLWIDVLFGPAAAIITFCGALVVMDGQLHPLLLFGVFFGMGLEHILVGVWVCCAIRKGRRLLREMQRQIRHFWGFCMRLGQCLRLYGRKMPKKDEKGSNSP